MNSGTITRRGFLMGGAALAAEAASPSRADAGGRELDAEAIAFISDLHLGQPLAAQRWKTMRDYPHQPAATAALVQEILSMPRPPANVICLGDLSLAFGEGEDYDIAAEVLKPLAEAGIRVTHAMGNHDIREEFLARFPGYDKATQVPGRFVSKVETPHADFIVLDSLVEPTKRGDYGACTRQGLGEEQLRWLGEAVAAAKKPLFLCAHHAPHGLKIPFAIPHNRIVAGWLHGHSHVWTTGYLRGGLDDEARMLRTVGLPTLGFEMDVGWGLMRTSARGAALLCNARDHYYPLPKPKAERPPEWDAHVRDWAGRKIGFAFAV